MKDTNRLFVGLLLIFLGFGFFLDQLGIFHTFGFVSFMGTFWPLILVMLGIVLIIRQNYNAGLVFAALGVLFQVSELFGWKMWAIFWPLIIVGVGILILLRRTSDIGGFTASRVSSEDTVHISALFAGIDKKVSSQQFTGGNINCMFGGVKLDLRSAKIAQKGAVLTISSAFGGVEIIVPKGARIESNGTPILGGWENKFTQEEAKDAPLLKITGSIAFGGVEVKD
jgi:predicted membrane protein